MFRNDCIWPARCALELVWKPSFVATYRDFRAKAVQPDEGVACATPRRDGRLAAENIGVLAEYGVSKQALVYHIVFHLVTEIVEPNSAAGAETVMRPVVAF